MYTLSMRSSYKMASSGPHLVNDLEAAYQNCVSAITKQEHFNVNDPDEVKTSVEQSIQRYLDLAKQLECFFLQKRLLLSNHRPEQILKEDIVELKHELSRKDILIQKHYEKLQHWQTMLLRIPGSQGQQGAQTSAAPMPQATPSTPQGTPGQSQAHGGMTQGSQMPTMQTMAHQVSGQGTAAYPQGPLAYLEQTTSNIGMPERR